AADAGHGGALGEEFADRRDAAVAVDEAALDVLVVDKGAENLAAVGDADALVVGRERRFEVGQRAVVVGEGLELRIAVAVDIAVIADRFARGVAAGGADVGIQAGRIWN